jgi:xanthine dehydrogenase accessory factor
MEDAIFEDCRVLIKGAGDLATGVAWRLWRAGFPLAMTELSQPLALRRCVAFAEAIHTGETSVEGVTARRVEAVAEAPAAWAQGVIPVFVDSQAALLAQLRPEVVVDAIMAKRNLGTHLEEAPLVIGLGPGFTAGMDVHVVIETNRGHYLGRALWSGSAQPDTGTPGAIAGQDKERVVRAPARGVFVASRQIGEQVKVGDLLGQVDGTPVLAPLSGVLRGLVHTGLQVEKNLKIGDIDPRGDPDYCRTISDKALAIGGGVLEAILVYLREKKRGT